jgi:hypothetical protein
MGEGGWERESTKKGGGIESNSKLATPPWAKAQPIADIPGRVPTCATLNPTESTDTTLSARRQNARQQSRRVALSSHRCRPPLLSRCAIHEAFRLRCLDRCHGRLSVRVVLLGYVNSCAIGYTINSPEENAFIQRWRIQQSRDCGLLCALVVCSASSVASYLPTNGPVVSPH